MSYNKQCSEHPAARTWPIVGGCLMAVVFACAAVVMQAAVAPSASLAAECNNEAIRVEQGSTFLPDCRAYELVSPGSNPLLSDSGTAENDRASTDGEGIAYFSRYPAKSATRSGYYYLATRGATGWSIEEVAPQDSPEAAELFVCAQGVYFSADLSRSVLSDGWNSEEEAPGDSYCQSSEEQLAAGAPAGYGNLFFREGTTAPYQLVNVTPSTAIPANAWLEDATGDLSHILFREGAQLTPEAPAGGDLYEWAGGSLRLVTFSPEGAPVLGRLAYGNRHADLSPVTHAVSEDGERVFFTSEHEGRVDLYVREHAMQPQSAVSGGRCTESAKACTVQVDVSHGTGASGGGMFSYASQDGSRVFFTDESRLTSDSGAASERPDLYEYDVETDQLKDVTPLPSSKESAYVRGFSGASEDGSYVYFVAKGNLTGTQANSEGATAQAFRPNLYLDHEGALTFIATLKLAVDGADWQETSGSEIDLGSLTARVSPSGQYIGFNSVNSLTQYDNIDSKTGQPDSEIFLYDTATNKISCVSCSPKGAAPVAGTTLPEQTSFFFKAGGGTPEYLSRNVLDDGVVFFTTLDSLLPQDTNGAGDVYEYVEGKLHLITTGAALGGSAFYDASPSGNDVFFVTPQGLVASDKDGNDSLYDARVNGGFAAGEGEGVEAPACTSLEACRRPPSEAPVQPFAASSVLSVPGNVTAPAEAGGPIEPAVKPCAAGRVRNGNRCVRSAKRKKVKQRKKKRRKSTSKKGGRAGKSAHKSGRAR